MFRKIRKIIETQKYKCKHISISYDVELNDVEIEEYANFAHDSQVSHSKIGKRTSVGRYSKIQYSRIGKYCSISWDVTIGALSHPLSSVSSHAFTYRKQFGLCKKDIFLDHSVTEIGNDVWIGAGVIILPGINVGDGAVIGAGSVVTHDVLPYEIVAGCPAKHLKWRFNEDIRGRLLAIKWWDFSDETIIQNIELFNYQNDITDDLEILNKLEALKK